MSFVAVPRPRRSPILFQYLAALTGGLVLFLLAVGVITGGYRQVFSNRVFPGVWMAGVDLSNLTPEQATAALNRRLTYPANGSVVFRDGDRVWVATPAELGMVFDAGTSVQNAFQIGRRQGLFSSLADQLNAWQGGLDLAPVIILDERVAYAYLQNIAAQIDKPVIEADLHLNGTEVVYTPGQAGRLLNVDDTLGNLLAQLEAFRDGEVPLVVEEQTPAVLDASAQADFLRQALSAPLTLTIADAQAGDPAPWTIEPSLLAGLLTVGRVQTETGWIYQVSIDAQAIEQFLGQIAPQLNRSPENARFYFDDASRQLVLNKLALAGRTLDIAATRDAIVQNLSQGQHTVPLVLVLAQPKAPSNATAELLGITGLVSSYTSYFRGSSAARMQNIQAAASRFYGLLIPPNTTFSMGEAIGDISLENGFAEALIIYNGRTITGVGGGVCQVSTTLFRTAYYGGYPIAERHAHAYRVLYYEQTATGLDRSGSLAGLDATVYFPLVDLKFTNDRPYWLLMETYFNADTYSLTWKFYSGDDGRTVDDPKQIFFGNVVPAPEPSFVENPDLAPDTCKQVDWPGDGADITVTRSVYLNGQRLTLEGDTIKTHYEPWQAVYQYGPGTDNPEALCLR